ncbi:MAG: VOC family protein [Polyangiaceae bacterium]|nr:VOC family protein [Polyangiaceae bacterium]
MASTANPNQRKYASVTPYLTIRGAAQAIEFYKKAFGAADVSRMPTPDGRIMHAEIKIGDSIIMLSDEFPEMGGEGGPQSLGGSPVTLHLQIDGDIDAAFARAVAAGAKVKMPLADMFWGDRYGALTDPFGHEWAMAKHIEVVSPEEMARRGAAAFSRPKKS